MSGGNFLLDSIERSLSQVDKNSFNVKRSYYDAINKQKKVLPQPFVHPEVILLLTDEEKEGILKNLEQIALADSQINADGKFASFTEFQDVMLNDLCMIELLFEGDENSLTGKTIGELYKESISNDFVEKLNYEDFHFDVNEMFEMSKKENWIIYRNAVLGKFVRYGFSDIKIKEKISGEDGFDAFILEDVDGNTMVYYPGTNLVEKEDFLYDCYPIIDSLTKKSDFIGQTTGSIKIHKSQQKQALDVLKSCIESRKPGSTVTVGGFSLGGSLGEYSYLKCMESNSSALGDLRLFNPYHNRLSSEEATKLKKTNKVKLYVSEGDSVCTVFNYEEFKDIAIPIYIDYKNQASTTVDNVNSNKSALNLVGNHFKNQFYDMLISKCIEFENKSQFGDVIYDPLVRGVRREIETMKQQDFDFANSLTHIDKVLNKVIPVFDKVGINLEEKYDLEFLENIQYIEYLLTSTHLTSSVDHMKKFSFDENGNIRRTVNIGDVSYEVRQPSFDETSKEILGSNPYKEVANIIGNIEN